MMFGPTSSYSFFPIHMFWKQPVEPRMLPPIQEAKDLSKLFGVVTTFSLLVCVRLAYLGSDVVEALFVALDEAWQQGVAT